MLYSGSLILTKNIDFKTDYFNIRFNIKVKASLKYMSETIN